MNVRILTVALILAITAATVLGLGKSEGDKKKVEEPLIKKEPAKTPVKPTPPAQPKEAEKKPQTPAPKPTAPKPVPTKVNSTPPDPTKNPTVKPPAENKVLATVNGKKIMSAEVEPKVEQMVNRQMASLGSVAGMLPPNALEGMKDRVRPQVVEALVEQELVAAKLKSMNILVTDEQVDGQIDTIIKQNNMTLESVKKDLEKNGLSMSEFRRQVSMNLGLEQLLKVEMAGKIELVDEAAARKYYDANQQRYNLPERVRASHILIKTEGLDEAGKKEARTRIDGLLEKVKAGEDFAELAKAHSDCPSKARGGDLDFFDKKRMVPEFSEAAFAMKVGEVSDIVETKFGYHIIKTTDRKDAEVRSFESEKDNIITLLTRQKQREFWNDYRKKMKEDAKVEYSPEIQAAMDKAAAPRPVPVAPQPQPK